MSYTPPSQRRRFNPILLVALLLGVIIAAGVTVIAYNSYQEASNRRDREQWPALLKERRRQADLGYSEGRDGMPQERPGAEAAAAREEGLRLERRLREIKARNPDLQWNPSPY
jgi:Tfp pilus assembly protein PilE